MRIYAIGKRGVCSGNRDKPPPCPKMDRMSPSRNSFVSHLVRMAERLSASKKVIRRPRNMYMEAAKKAGPSKMSMLCMMYGINVQSGVCLEE